jgi:TPR repeat protein
MKRHALFIGIDRYEDAQISSLACAESDAVELHGFFKHRIGYEVAEFLLAPSADQILDTVARLVAPLGPDDLFLFFFAGHGVTHERRDLLLSAKARHSRLTYLQQVVPMDMLLDETTRPGLNRVFVLDACRSNLLRDRQAAAEGFAGMASTRDIVARATSTHAEAGGSLALICSCEKGGQAGEIPERRGGVFRLALQTVLDTAAREGRHASTGDEMLAAVASEMDRLAHEHELPRRQRPSREAMVGTPPQLFPAKPDVTVIPARTMTPPLPELAPQLADAEELYQRGEAVYFGRGVPQSYTKAARLFREAAEGGNSAAELSLGRCYLEGRGVPKHDVEAVRWFRIAAGHGNAMARFYLGLCYDAGWGVDGDEAIAVSWFRMSAEQGYWRAQINLAMCYAYGRGVGEDKSKAVHWCRMAAEQGDVTAQFLLGKWLALGWDGKIDEAAAAAWFREAADQGYARAQLNLAMCYAAGRGVWKDKAEAVRWYQKAALQGDPDALEALRERGLSV